MENEKKDTVEATPPQVRITAQPSMTDPNLCKFTVEVTVHEGRPVRISSREAAADSPLAQKLFEIPQVSAVSFAGNTITVAKAGNDPWAVVARQIGPAIRAHLASGLPAVTRESEGEEGMKSDGPLFARVQEVVESMVNPALAGHGGWVKLVGVDKDTAFVEMGGGCHGCSMSRYTLQQGIAQAIMQHCPEITSVEDTTDHSTGSNPYMGH